MKFTDMNEENRLLAINLIERYGGKVNMYCEDGGLNIELPDGVVKWTLVEALARSFGLELVGLYFQTWNNRYAGHFRITMPEIAS